MNNFKNKSGRIRAKSGWVRAAVISTAFLAFIAGCDNRNAAEIARQGEVWKQQVQEAFERNSAITNYRFNGEISLQMAGNPTEQAALSASQESPLQSGIAWSGAHHRDPLRLEADIRIGTTQIPLLIQDGTMYFSIPKLNRENEYFAWSMGSGARENQKQDGASVRPEQAMLQAASALHRAAEPLVAGIDPRWIRATTNESDRPANRYTITLSKENAEEMEQAFRNGWKEWSQSFPETWGLGGVLPDVGENDFDLNEGGSVTVTVDEQGFVTAQTIELTFVAADTRNEGKESGEPIGRFIYKLELLDINDAPDISRTVPNNVLPFEHVLAFLAANGKLSAP